jgi:hypothetical protein
MADIDFNKPSVGSMDSNKVALTIRNRGIGGCLNCVSPETGIGAQAEGGTGIMGITRFKFGTGVFGEAQHPEGGTGVTGKSKSWIGVYGESETAAGVVGVAKTWVGVHGASTQKGGHGVFGEAQHPEGGSGVIGKSKNWVGVYGESDTKIGIWGKAPVAGYFEGTGIKPVAGHFEGNVEVTGDIELLNADCAENFDTVDENVDSGTVMVLTENGSLAPSTKEYDRKVAGIVSGAGGYKPGIILDSHNSPNKSDRLPIALLGKTFCKVDARHASIEIGDLLTTSLTKGHAMKAENPTKAFGAVIGKALGSISRGLGLIPVLVTLQ